jgi:DMSO reductase anchor subunit
MSAGSALIGFGAGRTGRPRLARRARVTATLAIGAGAGFLVADLGRPERFANMLRVAKPTSPMSVGSWLLAAYGPAVGVTAACDLFGVRPDFAVLAETVSAVLAPVVATYTAVIVADTSVPAWHEARSALPFVFASGAAAGAGGLAVAVAPLTETAPVRRLVLGAVIADLVAHRAVDGAVGASLAVAYQEGRAGRLRRISEGLMAAGAAVVAVAGPHRRAAAVIGGLMVATGATVDRFAVAQAGLASARDPAQTVGPQRRRLVSGR